MNDVLYLKTIHLIFLLKKTYKAKKKDSTPKKITTPSQNKNSKDGKVLKYMNKKETVSTFVCKKIEKRSWQNSYALSGMYKSNLIFSPKSF